VAAENPALLAELVALWHVEAGKYFGLPMEDRTALEVLLTPRPQMSPPRDRYVYFPNTLEVPEAVAVNVRGRSFKIAAEVDVAADPSGVLFAHGHQFGGHALYVKDGKLHYVYNYLGLDAQTLFSDIDVPAGPCVLGVEFVKESQTPAQTEGIFTLFVDENPVATLSGARIQNGKFNLCGEGLNIGRDGGAPVTLDYPGERPWAFSGGTIARVVVDVSGEPYVDLEKEAIAMMKRD
jgi:arylsulfatase